MQKNIFLTIDNVAKGTECLRMNIAINAKLEGNLFWKPNSVQL